MESVGNHLDQHSDISLDTDNTSQLKDREVSLKQRKMNGPQHTATGNHTELNISLRGELL